LIALKTLTGINTSNMTYKEKDSLQREKDIARVEHTLSVLKDYWLERPYLRLGQLVSNAFYVLPEYTNPELDVADIFYIPDNRLLEGLSKLTESERESKSKGTA
jgi:hypothetical protein